MSCPLRMKVDGRHEPGAQSGGSFGLGLLGRGLLVALLVAAGLSPAPIHAAGHDACTQFGNLAEAQARVAEELGCSVEGAQWQQSIFELYKWCLDQPLAEVAAVFKDRQTVLRACVGNDAAGYCTFYAEIAAAQAETAFDNGCDPDPTWKRGLSSYHSSCFSTSRQEAEAALNRRAASLKTCGGF